MFHVSDIACICQQCLRLAPLVSYIPPLTPDLQLSLLQPDKCIVPVLGHSRFMVATRKPQSAIECINVWLADVELYVTHLYILLRSLCMTSELLPI